MNLERGPVDVGEVFQELGFPARRFPVFLAARQHVEIGARTLLAANDPIERGGDDVEHQRQLPTIAQRLRVFLSPLDVVVHVVVDSHVTTVIALPVELPLVHAEKAAMQTLHRRGVETVAGHLARRHRGLRNGRLVFFLPYGTIIGVQIEHPNASDVAGLVFRDFRLANDFPRSVVDQGGFGHADLLVSLVRRDGKQIAEHIVDEHRKPDHGADIFGETEGTDKVESNGSRLCGIADFFGPYPGTILRDHARDQPLVILPARWDHDHARPK